MPNALFFFIKEGDQVIGNVILIGSRGFNMGWQMILPVHLSLSLKVLWTIFFSDSCSPTFSHFRREQEPNLLHTLSIGRWQSTATKQSVVFPTNAWDSFEDSNFDAEPWKHSYVGTSLRRSVPAVGHWWSKEWPIVHAKQLRYTAAQTLLGQTTPQ